MADVEPRISDMMRAAALALVLLAGLPAAAASAEPLTLVSYNVQFVTPVVPGLSRLLRELPGHKPNVAARAEAIGAALACADVIGFQETVNDQRRAELFEALQSHGADCGKPSRLASGLPFALLSGPPLPADAIFLPWVDDELALASRLPIVARDWLTFSEAAGPDALAAKGVLHARLARSPEDTLDVFVTHLQEGEEHAAERRAQIAELAAFVARRAAPQGPLALLGDLNLWGGAADRADPASEYNHLMATLAAALAPRRPVDLWLATHPDDPETGSGTKRRVLEDGSLRPREKRIDFILLAGAGQARPLTMRRDFLAHDLMIDGAPLGDLSNHAALLAEIFWQPPADPLTAAAGRAEDNTKRLQSSP